MGQLLNITDDLKGVDPRMVDIVKRAAAASPYDVKITDAMRAGGKGNHKHGYAIDVALIDPRTGAELPNKMYYKNGTIIPGAVDAFPVYERFAQTARVYQTQQYPELNNTFRWGGGFQQGGTPFDMMHLDITPKAAGGMAYYDWNTGLTPAALARIPELKGSEGLGGANGRRLVGALGQTLQGGPVPPGSIPDVASLTDTQRAPVAPMPLPSFMRPSASSATPLSKTLGGGIPDAAMFGVRFPEGSRKTSAADLIMTPGQDYGSSPRNPPGVIADDRLMDSLLRSQDARADAVGPGPSSWFGNVTPLPQVAAPTVAETRAEQQQMRAQPAQPSVPLPRPRPSTDDGSSDLLQQALNQRSARLRDEMGFGTITAPSMAETRAEQAQIRASAPSGALRAVTPGVQPAGSVQMAAARPSSVPMPANEFQFLAPAPGAAQPVVAPTMAETRNEMALMRVRPMAAMTAPTPFPSRGVPVTPAPMPQTPSPALRAASQPMPQRPALPAPSAHVGEIQRQLLASGFNPGSADGIFGPKTDAAVRAFQQANGLAVDGIVGPQTLAALSRQQAPTPMPSLPRSSSSQQERSAPTPMPSRPAGFGSKGYSDAGKQLLAMFG